MNTVADLGAEHVVDEPVLGASVEPGERRRTHNRVEVVTIAGNLSHRLRDARLDPFLELLRCSGHVTKRSDPPLYFVKQ